MKYLSDFIAKCLSILVLISFIFITVNRAYFLKTLLLFNAKNAFCLRVLKIRWVLACYSCFFDWMLKSFNWEKYLFRVWRRLAWVIFAFKAMKCIFLKTFFIFFNLKLTRTCFTQFYCQLLNILRHLNTRRIFKYLNFSLQKRAIFV